LAEKTRGKDAFQSKKKLDVEKERWVEGGSVDVD